MKMGNNNNKGERYQWNNLHKYLKLMYDKNSDGLSEFNPALKNLKNIIDLDVNSIKVKVHFCHYKFVLK